MSQVVLSPPRGAGLVAPAARARTWRRVGILRALVGAMVAGLFALEVWAIAVAYGLRVTSDTPTFLALLREQALHPFAAVSPFLVSGHVETSHATPYMQVLAWLWDAGFARHDAAGAPLPDPVGAYRVLAAAGLVVSAVVLHASFVWFRRNAGSRAAWISLPVLLVLFGPAHVIWAGDLSLHGFLYASFYPQTLALGLLLYTLVAVDGPRTRRRTLAATAAAAGTMVVHPFTGALLAVLLAAHGCAGAAKRRPGWELAPIALAAGYAVGCCWPAYSLSHALAVAGPSGTAIVAACSALPLGVRLAGREWLRPLTRLAAAPTRLRLPSVPASYVAGLGLLVVLGLVAWQAWLLDQPNPDPLIHSNRLALYWVEDRWRWPLMFAAGAVGLSGLVALARRGRSLPLVWFGLCFGVGVGGLAGLPIPVWWRFLLFCQLPLALGVADAVVRSTRRAGRTCTALLVFALAFTLARALGASARRRVPILAATPRDRHRAAIAVRVLVAMTVVAALAFKLTVLLELPDRITYWGNDLQEAYQLGEVVPPGSGLVATDPFTAYYVPAATGSHVLSVTKAHVGSAEELGASEDGYRLLHAYATGGAWWQAAQRMWLRGVRYVVVEKHTLLRAGTLASFSTGPTPLVRSSADRRWLGTYFYRNNRVGTLVHDSDTYAVYRLERRKLWP